MEKFNNVNSIFKIIASEKLKKGDCVVDATAGNGNDILFMMNIVGKKGTGYCFDIQKEAIENTTSKLLEEGYIDNVEVIFDGHENVDTYVTEKIDFAVFNLGYLPKANHDIITKSKTTIISLEKIMKLLKKNGCIVVSAYVGHDGGMDEFYDLKDYLSIVDQKKYNISCLEFINQKNNPPKLIVIEKR